ncbi:hypothetical protein BDV11DRAFT_207913 [Aspergillus similis]
MSLKSVPPAAVGATVLAYLVLCSTLRHRRARRQAKRLNYPDRQSLSRMTNVEAQAIIQEMAEWEFPTTFTKSLQFALFKTYGVPSISQLLVATRMFSTPENASRRYEDTNVLIGEFLSHDPREERTRKAIARINYLHSPVFVTEPRAFVNRFEWRELTDLEVCALGTFGRAWRDGIEFVDDITEWALQYAGRHMVPDKASNKTAEELIPLLLFYMPRFLTAYLRQSVGVLMGERLRWAMFYPEPSNMAYAATYAVLSLRRFILRYFALPRFFPARQFGEKDPQTNRYYHKTYLVHPYYVKPSFSSRWGPSAWFTWAVGGVLPIGYEIETVGPPKRRGLGKEEMAEFERKIEAVRPAGCPFMLAK